MIKNIWKNYSRYLKISKKETKISISLGIIGALLETLTIYLLAHLITDLGYESNVKKVEIINISNFEKKTLGRDP